MTKIREKVNLRKRTMRNGGQSLYLDWFFHGARQREFLGLYLGKDKVQNATTMRLAQQLKAKKMEELIAMEAGIPIKRFEATNITLKDYAAEVLKDYDKKNTANSMRVFVRKLPEKVVLAAVDRDMFAKILRDGWGHLNVNTQNLAASFLRLVLKKAHRAKLINEVPDLEGLIPAARPGNKVFLTMDELRLFMNVEPPTVKKKVEMSRFRWNMTKNAFLFSCFTGLRYSDMRKITWGDIQDGILVLVQQKTSEPVRIPLSANALEFLPERTKDMKDRDSIVPLPLTTFHADQKVTKLSEMAGIKKHVTFHCARHTCATLMLSYGADLFTVSKILGHTDIKTTQIYTKVLDEGKRKAVELVPKI